MGLNLDITHVAFSGVRKFDGRRMRDLQPNELAQIAGRAGRYMTPGTFGVTGDVDLNCPIPSLMQSPRTQIHAGEETPVAERKARIWRNRPADRLARGDFG